MGIRPLYFSDLVDDVTNQINKDLAGKTKEQRIEDMCGELECHKSKESIKEIVSHHIGVLWETIQMVEDLYKPIFDKPMKY